MTRHSAAAKARDATAPAEALELTRATELACARLESTGNSSDAASLRPAAEAHLRFLLSELELAITFCRCARAVSAPHFKSHVIQNARNALFNVTYFVLRVDFPDHSLEVISAALSSLKAALQQISSPDENSAEKQDSLHKEVKEWITS